MKIKIPVKLDLNPNSESEEKKQCDLEIDTDKAVSVIQQLAQAYLAKMAESHNSLTDALSKMTQDHNDAK